MNNLVNIYIFGEDDGKWNRNKMWNDQKKVACASKRFVRDYNFINYSFFSIFYFAILILFRLLICPIQWFWLTFSIFSGSILVRQYLISRIIAIIMILHTIFTFGPRVWAMWHTICVPKTEPQALIRAALSFTCNNCSPKTIFISDVYVFGILCPYSIQFLYLITWISSVLISVYWPNVQLVFLKRSAISIIPAVFRLWICNEEEQEWEKNERINNRTKENAEKRRHWAVNKWERCNLISSIFIGLSGYGEWTIRIIEQRQTRWCCVYFTLTKHRT